MLVRNSDQQAFAEIYNRYWKKLLLASYHKLNHYQEAQEIVQLIFIDIWKRRENWELDHSLTTYLLAAVKYRVINFYAAKDKARQIQEFSEQDPVHHSSSGIDLRDLQTEISSIVENLPEKCRLVFRLSREYEYNHKQIASELGIAEKTVQAHITLALRRLKTGLGSFWILISFISPVLYFFFD